MNSLRPSPIPKVYMVQRKKLECYGNFFAIEGEMGTADEYPWVSVIGQYPNIFPEELPRLPIDKKIRAPH